MRKSLLNAIVIIVSLLMITGCPDPANVRTPSSHNRPSGGGSGASTTSVNYTVKHMKQDVSGDGYTEDTASQQTLSGTPGASTAAQARSFTGFTAQTFSQATIAADGSTVVTINYNRNVHSVSYSATTAGVTAPATASYRYGAQVTVQFPTGITAWSHNGTTYTATNNTLSMPDSNVVLAEIYTVSASNVAETLQALNDNNADTPYTLIVSNSSDLAAITQAISSSDVYVSLSLEGCEGLTSLDADLFQGCDNLTSIVIPETITSVGSNVFSDCTNLESVTLPGSLDQTSIQNVISSLPSNTTTTPYAIEVTNVSTNNQISNIKSAINSSGKYVELSLENCTELTSLPDSAFQNCNKITSITLPDNIEAIGDAAFTSCSSITSLTIPPSVTSIGDCAFYRCSSLNNITIQSSITSISNSAFGNCTSLESITIPSSVTSIGIWAFECCTSLESVTIPSSVTSIGQNAFTACTNLENIVIPDSVTSVGTDIFSECTNLESITLPGTLNPTSIQNVISSLPEDGNNASNPYSIEVTNVTTNDQISNIKTAINSSGKYVDLSLENCTELTSLPNNAFEDCDNLTSITIPSSVTSMGTGVFSDCTSLKSVTLPGTLNQTYIQNVISSLPTNTTTTSYTIGMTDVTTDTQLSYIKAAINSSGKYVDLSLENCTDLTSLPDDAFNNCSKIKSIILPDSITTLGNRTFSVCYDLTSIVIPSSVTSLGNSTFEECHELSSITFPENSNLTSIGNLAFSYCEKLQSITIPSSVTSIGNYAFNECGKLQSIVIPDSVTSIGTGAFCGCSRLASITISSSVTSIGSGVFSYCSKLQTINFQGTTAQWNSISKGNDWNLDCPSSMQVVCTDGTTTP